MAREVASRIPLDSAWTTDLEAQVVEQCLLHDGLGAENLDRDDGSRLLLFGGGNRRIHHCAFNLSHD